jgi:hypothetical protein
MANENINLSVSLHILLWVKIYFVGVVLAHKLGFKIDTEKAVRWAFETERGIKAKIHG